VQGAQAPHTGTQEDLFRQNVPALTDSYPLHTTTPPPGLAFIFLTPACAHFFTPCTPPLNYPPRLGSGHSRDRQIWAAGERTNGRYL